MKTINRAELPIVASRSRVLSFDLGGVDEGDPPFIMAETSGYGAQHAANGVNRWPKARRT